MHTPDSKTRLPGSPKGAAEEELRTTIQDLFKPRLIVCIAGAYPDGSAHCLGLNSAREVLRLTKTNACVIQIPFFGDHIPERAVSIIDLLDAFANRQSLVPILNTSRARCAEQAVSMIRESLRAFGPLQKTFPHSPLLKLEILTPSLEVIDDEVLHCLEQLPMDLRQRTIPILNPSPGKVSDALALGCPSVRLLVGNIGHATGILNPIAVERAIAEAQDHPVILEGGLDTPAQIQECANMGAAAVLVNSVFKRAHDPVARARDLREAADRAWP